jgi:hypothetical protein
MGGIGSGGFRPNSGRPPGARNLKARALIEQAEADDLLTPIGFLLSLMRDPRQSLHNRMMAANICMPYLHPRLSMIRVTADPAPMSDEQLLAGISQFEAIVAAMPERDRVAALENKLEDALEEARQLSQTGREAVFRKMIEDGEAGLQRLHEPPPGAVLPHPAPTAASVIQRPGDHPQPAPAESRRLRYDPLSRKMVSVLQQ